MADVIIPIFAKVAVPSPLLGGNFKATCVNLFFGILVMVLVDVLAFLVLVALGQLLVVYLSNQNIFFLDEKMACIKNQNRQAKTITGEVYA